MKKQLIRLIKFYQNNISRNTTPTCRFNPTCSNYTIDAIDKHGVIIGSTKALRRFIICNPLGPHGYDPA